MAATNARIIAGPIRKPRNKQRSLESPTSETSSYSVDTESEEELAEEDTMSLHLTKTVDFVLVYKKSDINESALRKMETFLFNLEQKGFELDSASFSLNDEINFIKIYAPVRTLLYFAEIFGIELAFQNVGYKIYRNVRPYRFMATQLTDPDVLDPIYQRARATFSGAPPVSLTNAEKGLIIYKVLSKNPYGDDKSEYGIQKLINRNIFECAFPLHDGLDAWTEEGPLNDRQLLARYWSGFSCWYKQQPLDLIERYYGPETGFYFAWVGFYMKMLIPASIAGFAIFLLGIASFSSVFSFRSKEVCESQLLLCPRCIVHNCKFEPLENSCFHSSLIYFFDNPLVIAFAALMSVWSTVFLELWRREESILQIRWNLRSVKMDFSMRPEFEEKASSRRVSPITGTLEPYMSKTTLCYRYAITFSVVVLLVILMILGIIGVMIYVKTVSVVLIRDTPVEGATFNVGLVASFTGSIVSVLFILAFEAIYLKIALWLTNTENPRTQIDFDNSFTYKCYAMSFVNYYSVIFYIAFVKARFYTYPGDESLWTDLGGLKSDLCEPSGCIVELGIQLIIVLLAKNLILTARQYVIPRLEIFVNKLRKKKRKNVEVHEHWERDYLLNPLEKYHIMKEYMSMVIQYGFVTFFVAAFPPAPLLALFNNLIELRVDATKMTGVYRRPVAFKIANLRAWNGILQGVTYIGVATNAFVIAFTSEFVQRTVYQHNVRYDLHGFVNSTLSAYNVSEYSMVFEPDKNVSVCYYPGKRYPPDHSRKYQLTNDYWFNLAMKFLAVVIFEHVIMLVTGIVAYVIPDIPFSVREHINLQRDQTKEIQLKSLRKKYMKDQEKHRADVFADM